MTIAVPQSPSDPREFFNGIDADGNFTSARVGIEDLSYKGRFGALAYSTTQNSISIGEKYFTLDVDDGKFRTGDDILITSLDDQDCYMWGEVLATDTVWEPLRLRVFVDDLSALTGTYQNWELQVVARPKPGIEKDTSTSSVNPTTGGPWTFTVTAGKFFPIGGTLLIKPTTDRSIALIGEVAACSGTSLTVTLRATNATVSQTYDSWSIALLDSPPAKMPLYGIEGLIVSADTSEVPAVGWVNISAGSVMDSTGTVLLTLDSDIQKNLKLTFAAGDGNGGGVRVLLAGTISESGGTVTGTGTAFTSDFPSSIQMNDYVAQGGTNTFRTIVPTIRGVISTASEAETVSTVTDDDTLLTNGGSVLTATNAAYYRGGFYETTSFSYTVFIVIIRKDSDGSIDVCACSDTATGAPDLPSGYTYYRVLAAYGVDSSQVTEVRQPLYDRLPFGSKDLPYFLSAPYSGFYLDYPAAKSLEASTSITLTAVTSTQTQVRRAALTGDVTASANSNATTIANDAVSNAKLANMAAYTIKGRNAGTTGDPSDIDITALTEQTSPTTTDYLIGVDTAASNAFKKYKASNFGGGTTFPADMGIITEAATITYDCGTIV